MTVLRALLRARLRADEAQQKQLNSKTYFNTDNGRRNLNGGVKFPKQSSNPGREGHRRGASHVCSSVQRCVGQTNIRAAREQVVTAAYEYCHPRRVICVFPASWLEN
ncbi:hypothetical protein EVAR_469_1 [Eumeta japonica]|uniref:Uncharacterized protein n=1 Tax=Eumeta variegata TaxID=151549 RepID=A0A4C1SD84_EUMVA|nr:hypothetical protein EVAR_469_1 [Eumeta japonica]